MSNIAIVGALAVLMVAVAFVVRAHIRRAEQRGFAAGFAQGQQESRYGQGYIDGANLTRQALTVEYDRWIEKLNKQLA